ncbi:hypothetical protein TVAG_172650 [Trichomonas vaginalis G3]|uniref:Uncharacterized protein n=1 Tax=Trichomonas vaginalis (strain ATCC PRA-98 / G3) TaxID=412133 RepID=A2DF16_TRIV3|nr:hypothetical protein TVAGG3_0531600 [Trichomonas vaginalis G3]EAY21008.1 hypothetical protein TVAG_172650 [Trichomonas vaginalis G3]KAI5519185.1 hypothetical protein TVAGG3_0531600 [Trichomonas vaginalis G3]|eukprot:XP_001581994.1 hypothetical protein [Trichomonas vaginalis G3]
MTSLTIPDECSDAYYTEDATYEIQENKKKCIFVTPGFFFGTDLRVEAYWQEENQIGSFNYLGPAKAGSIVNINSKAYVILLSPTAQTVKYFPASTLSKTTTSVTGSTQKVNTYFSSKTVTEYNISIKASKNSTISEELLLLGDEVSVRNKNLQATINDIDTPIESNSFRNEKSGSFNRVSFGNIQLANEKSNEVTIYQAQISATLKSKLGVPQFAGIIPQAPSIATIKDVDNSYAETVITSPTESGSSTSSPSEQTQKLPVEIIIGGVIALVAVAALSAVIIIVNKHNKKQIEDVDQEYSHSAESGSSNQSNTEDSDYSKSVLSYESSRGEISIDDTTNTSTIHDATATMGDTPLH